MARRIGERKAGGGQSQRSDRQTARKTFQSPPLPSPPRLRRNIKKKGFRDQGLDSKYFRGTVSTPILAPFYHLHSSPAPLRMRRDEDILWRFSMAEFQELLAVDELCNLKFFAQGLWEFAPTDIVSAQETRYVGSVLAHYSLTSCVSTDHMPTPTTLADIFDTFVLGNMAGVGHEMFETAGGQSLMLLGFFPNQMRRRHSLRWYTELGRTFYEKASAVCPNKKKSVLLKTISHNFPVWTTTCQRFHRHLIESRYLLPPSNTKPQS